MQARAKAALESDQQQMQAKLGVLQDRSAKAKGDVKARIQQRVDKLRKAWERTKEKAGSHPS